MMLFDASDPELKMLNAFFSAFDLSKAKAVALDMDGVLTDGKQYIDHTGEKLFKAFHSRDIRALRELVARGLRVVVLSADDWPGGAAWCERVGVEFYVTRDKLSTLINLDFKSVEVIFIGDDAWDMECIKWAGLSAIPSDADDSLKPYATCILDCPGGQGVVAKFLSTFFHYTDLKLK